MIYLDNSATTPLSEISIERLKKGYECFGNPSSLHLAGLEAEKLITHAREEVLLALGIKNHSAYRVIFTASGTEADNLAILGCARAKKFRFKPRIITTDSEHPAVLAPLSLLEEQGFDVIRLKTIGGVIDKNEFLSYMNTETVLVSIMTVNNETGAAYDLKTLFTLAKRINPNVITHTDCVQGFLKIPFSQPLSLADIVTVSGHKIHAPKGIGALVVSQSLITAKKIVPIIHGGGQELSLRSGTENTAGIYALGGAASEGNSRLSEFSQKAAENRKYFTENLPASVRVNTPSADYAPHIISITLPGIKSETMLHFLSKSGIYISSGSACSSNKNTKSSVLKAFGLSDKEADSTVRISLSLNNTKEEVILAAKEITRGCESLCR